MMDQVAPTLCRLSAIAFSKYLWLQSTLKEPLKACLDAVAIQTGKTESMRLAAETVMNNLCITIPAKEELKFTVGSMGCELVAWSAWLLSDSMWDDDNFLIGDVSTYVDYVHFTANGSVDTVKTIRSLYFEGMLSESITTWTILAITCQEDCLKDLRVKQPDFEELVNEHVLPFSRAKRRRRGIIYVYWLARMRQYAEPEIIAALHEWVPQLYDHTYSIAANMFMITLVKGRNYEGVKYFWDLMNENERMRAVTEGCEHIIAGNTDVRRWSAEDNLVVFTLQKLAHYGLQDITTSLMGCRLSNVFTWPYDDYSMRALVKFADPHKFVECKLIMEDLVTRICYCKGYQLFDRDVKYHEFFHTLWKMNIGNFKCCVNNKCLDMMRGANEVALIGYVLEERVG